MKLKKSLITVAFVILTILGLVFAKIIGQVLGDYLVPPSPKTSPPSLTQITKPTVSQSDYLRFFNSAMSDLSEIALDSLRTVNDLQAEKTTFEAAEPLLLGFNLRYQLLLNKMKSQTPPPAFQQVSSLMINLIKLRQEQVKEIYEYAKSGDSSYLLNVLSYDTKITEAANLLLDEYERLRNQ